MWWNIQSPWVQGSLGESTELIRSKALVLLQFHIPVITGSIVNLVVVVDLPLLCVAVEGSDNPITLEQPCQASLPPD